MGAFSLAHRAWIWPLLASNLQSSFNGYLFHPMLIFWGAHIVYYTTHFPNMCLLQTYLSQQLPPSKYSFLLPSSGGYHIITRQPYQVLNIWRPILTSVIIEDETWNNLKNLLWGSIFLDPPSPLTTKWLQKWVAINAKQYLKISANHLQNKTISPKLYKVLTFPASPQPQKVKHSSAGVCFRIRPRANKKNFSNLGQKMAANVKRELYHVRQSKRTSDIRNVRNILCSVGHSVHYFCVLLSLSWVLLWLSCVLS